MEPIASALPIGNVERRVVLINVNAATGNNNHTTPPPAFRPAFFFDAAYHAYGFLSYASLRYYFDISFR